MLFNSYIFVFLFLPLSLAGYFGLNKFRLYSLAKVFLIGMSFWFYGYFNPSYIVIMAGSICVNYILSYGMLTLNSKNLRKILFALGLIFNIGILFYFKYYDFFISNVNIIFKTDFNLMHLVLPLGISFFTFQQLSYVIDSYKKTVPKYNFFDYALFVTYFPQLIAGPIVLHSEVVPQFADLSGKKLNADNFAAGVMAFSFGMAKKVLIADTLGKIVGWGFADVWGLDSTNAIIVMLCYTLQIYFDFSGYCDMATGIAKMFNINLPMNFNSPYKAVTILDFWDRWHMTLTRFFTYYIYIPLGGNRKGKYRTYLNVFIVFLVSGIWHGANWTFIVWGLVHGIFNIFTRIFKKYFDMLPKIVNWFITFAFVNFAWVIFRADSLTQVKEFFGRIVKGGWGPVYQGLIDSVALPEFDFINFYLENRIPDIKLILIMGVIIFAMSASVFMKNTNERLKTFNPNFVNAVVVAFMLFYGIISLGGVSEFLYFNF